jgi:hypothetical protein
MTDPALITLSASGLVAVGLASAAALRGWHGWLELRRLEMTGRGVHSPRRPGSRMDLADLKARLRRLEAIANGVDL